MLAVSWFRAGRRPSVYPSEKIYGEVVRVAFILCAHSDGRANAKHGKFIRHVPQIISCRLSHKPLPFVSPFLIGTAKRDVICGGRATLRVSDRDQVLWVVVSDSAKVDLANKTSK